MTSRIIAVMPVAVAASRAPARPAPPGETARSVNATVYDALKEQITGHEQKVDEVKGTRDRRIPGDNSSDFRSRVARIDSPPPVDSAS